MNRDHDAGDDADEREIARFDVQQVSGEQIDASRFGGISVRFSSPVYPGDTIRTEMWKQGDKVQFRSTAVERNVVVLNNGVATLR